MVQKHTIHILTKHHLHNGYNEKAIKTNSITHHCLVDPDKMTKETHMATETVLGILDLAFDASGPEFEIPVPFFSLFLSHIHSFCHENKFLLCVNIPAKKAHSDSDSDIENIRKGKIACLNFLNRINTDVLSIN